MPGHVHSQLPEAKREVMSGQKESVRAAQSQVAATRKDSHGLSVLADDLQMGWVVVYRSRIT